jgi:hypothetical protein
MAAVFAADPGESMTKRAPYDVIRLESNPMVRPGMPGLKGADGENINGPSLIRVPDWVERPLGKYYLYFAHHGGKYIRLAYADRIEGPWTIHEGGVLNIADGPGRDHIASPDVHVDAANKKIRMYFHQPSAKGADAKGQVSFVALSDDGLRFTARKEVLGKFYFRVFQHGGFHYALAKDGNIDGIMYRSKDGLTGFEPGPHFLPGVRHTAVWMEKDTLHVAYSLVGEAPERLYVTMMPLTGDWKNWSMPAGQVLLEPETEYEGVKLPLIASTYGPIKGPARQLRDPAIFEEAGRRYLLYSVAGEQGIAVAELRTPTTMPAKR